VGHRHLHRRYSAAVNKVRVIVLGRNRDGRPYLDVANCVSKHRCRQVAANLEELGHAT